VFPKNIEAIILPRAFISLLLLSPRVSVVTAEVYRNHWCRKSFDNTMTAMYKCDLLASGVPEFPPPELG
jgi:hypothetical protein